MKRITAVSVFVLLLAIAGTTGISAQSEKLHEIQLLNRTFVPDAGFEQYKSAVGAFKQHPGKLPSGSYHAVIQFFENPGKAERDLLTQAHVTLHNYVPQMAFTASLPLDADLRLLRAANIRSIFLPEPGDKLSPLFSETPVGKGSEAGGSAMDILVSYYPDVSSTGVMEALGAIGTRVLYVSDHFHYVTVRVEKSSIMQLAGLEWVEWLAPLLARPVRCNFWSRNTIHVDAVQDPPWRLTGSGVRLGIWDGAAVAHHDAFLDEHGVDRVTIVDQVNPDNHATHVCGTMAGNGAGSTNNSLKGMAPSALIYSWDANTWETVPDEVLYGINTYGIIVSQNSWTAEMSQFPEDRFGIYDFQSRAYDRLIRENNINVVSAAGDDRDSAKYLRFGRVGWMSIPYGSGQCAKNSIVVGAVDHSNEITVYTDWGPTQDGRVKPDLVALGGTDTYGVNSTIMPNSYGYMQGTSMAAPAISGAVALLVEEFRARNGGANPKPALVKSILLNTANTLDRNYPPRPGPRYEWGYGVANVEASIQAIHNKFYWEDVIEHRWQETHEINVPAGAWELRVMLAYSDQEAVESANPTLVTDLDLVLVDPQGTTQYQPYVLDPAHPDAWAVRGENHRDNVEQVVVENPATGTWTIRVRGTFVPPPPPPGDGLPQEFAVSWWFPSTTIVADQKIEATGEQVGLLGRWNGTSFNPRFSPGSFLVSTIGTDEILLGDTIAIALPEGSQNKYRKWRRGSVTDIDLANHHVFHGISFENGFTSVFNEVSDATIQAQYIEGGGPLGTVNFTDPWFIDFVDPPYGNRNQGISAVPEPVQSVANNIGVETRHRGVFTDLPGPPDWQFPYYAVGAPDPGSIDAANFIKWSGSYVTFHDSFAVNTPAVFTHSGGTASALFKAHLGSSVPDATGTNSQRVVAGVTNTTTPYDPDSYYIVYPSVGELWRTVSNDGGTSWDYDTKFTNSGGTASAPSIALWDVDGQPIATRRLCTAYRQLVNNSYYQIRYADAMISPPTSTLISTTNIPANIDTRPVIARLDQEGLPYLFAFWQTGTGINYNFANQSGSTWYWIFEGELVSGDYRNPSVSVPDLTVGTPNLYLTYDNGNDVFIMNHPYTLDCPVPGSLGPASFSSQVCADNQSGEQVHVVWEAFGDAQVPPPGTDRGNTWPIDAPSMRHSVMYENWNGEWSPAYEFRSNSVDYHHPSVTSLANGSIVWAWDDGSSTYKAVNSGSGWTVTEFYSNTKQPNLIISGSKGPIRSTRVVSTSTTGPAYRLNVGTATTRPNDDPKALIIQEQYSRRVVVARRPTHRTGQIGHSTKGNGPVAPDSSAYVSVELSPLILKLRNGSLASVDFAGPRDSIIDEQSVWELLASAPVMLTNEIDSIVLCGGAKACAPFALSGKEIGMAFDVVDADRGTVLKRIGGERVFRGDTLSEFVYRDRVSGIGGRRVFLRPSIRGFEVRRQNLVSTLVHVYTAVGDSSSKPSGALAKESDPLPLLPTEYELHSNFPNPFNPTTEIHFDLPEGGNVSLVVYDVLGREVANLVSGYREAGYHRLTWSASGQASGVYFARFGVTNARGNVAYTKVNKLMLVR